MIPNNLTVAPIVLDAVSDPTLSAIDVLEDGTLRLEDIEGTVVDYVFNDAANDVHSNFPYRIELRIRKVLTAGTTIPLGSLIGLH